MVATRRHPAGDFPDPTTTTSTPTTTPSKSSSKSSSSPPAASSTSSIPTKKTPHHTRSPSKPSTSTSTSTSTSSTPSYIHHAPHSLTLWLLVSLPLVLWDTGYVFLRPHTMPGGSFHSPIWTPYALYATVDYVYGWSAWNERSGFTGAQAALNAVETVLYGWYLCVVWSRGGEGGRKGGRGKGKGDGSAMDEGIAGRVSWFVGWSEEGRRKVVQGPGVAVAVILAFSASVMTVSKTVLYWLHEYYSNFANIGHNDPLTLLIYWIIPNGAWLVFPSYMIYLLGKEIVDAMEEEGSSTDAKKAKR